MSGDNRDARREAARLSRKRFSMSLFVVYFGVRRQHTQIAHHDILFGPRYKPHLDEIFNGPDVSDDFSLYLHAPTLTDTSVAPDGCEAFYVLSPVPHQHSGLHWPDVAESYRRTIEKHLAETVLPDLGQHVVTSRMLTPLDFEQRLFSVKGAAFGLQPILTQTAWFRPHNRDPLIPGLYIVGAGTHPGAGLPGVISSAEVLASMVPDAPVLAPERMAAE